MILFWDPFFLFAFYYRKMKNQLFLGIVEWKSFRFCLNNLIRFKIPISVVFRYFLSNQTGRGLGFFFVVGESNFCNL